MIVPPNFGHVEDGIYRCGSPDVRSYGFLASLKLKTAILLTDTHDTAFTRFLQECGVTILCPRTCAPPARAAEGPYSHGSPPMGDARPQPAPYSQRPPPRRQQQQQQQQQGGGSAPRPPGAGEILEELAGERAGMEAVAGADPHVQESLLEGGAAVLVGGGAGSVTSLSPPVSPRRAEEAAAARQSNVARFLRANNAGGRAARPSLAPMAAVGVGDTAQAALGLYDDGGVGGSAGLADAPMRLTSGLVLDGGGGGLGGPVPLGGQRGLMTLSESVVVDILHVLLDPRYYPVLVTCPMGRYRTGIVCGCLRKLQRWNLVSILEEYRRFAGDKSRAENEDFIELFDKDLVSLELDGGRHPTILYD